MSFLKANSVEAALTDELARSLGERKARYWFVAPRAASLSLDPDNGLAGLIGRIFDDYHNFRSGVGGPR